MSPVTSADGVAEVTKAQKIGRPYQRISETEQIAKPQGKFAAGLRDWSRIVGHLAFIESVQD